MKGDRLPRPGFTATVRADLRRARRSTSTWILVAVVPALILIGFVLAISGDEKSISTVINSIAELIVFWLPLVGLLIGYNVILYERESGTILLSLSVPQSRLGLLLGKATARGSLLVIPLVGTLLVVGIGTVALGGAQTGDLLRYPIFMLLSVLYVLVFVGIGVTFSAWSTSSRRILLGSFLTYLVLTSYWSGLTEFFADLVYRLQLETFPTWASILQFSSPTQAYGYLLGQLYDSLGGEYYSLTDPGWVINQWSALLVLLIWVVFPTVYGYYQLLITEL